MIDNPREGRTAMIVGSYTAEGTKGLLKDGGSGRRTAIEKLAKSAV